MGAIQEDTPVRPLADAQIGRTHLESLTTSDLIRMADNLGIDIPPDLDRIFIIEELLELISTDEIPEESSGMSDASEFPSDLPAAPDMSDSGLVESVPLPKQYNFTFIEVMIRDPLWAFVFWEIKASEKEQFEETPGFDGYYLKVSPLKSQADDSQSGMEGVFTVPVKPDDTARYLGLTPAATGGSFQTDDRWYKVEFCVSLKGNESVLAVSNPVRLPGLTEFPAGAEKPNCKLSNNQLISSSGYEDFRIIRRNERLHRIKTYE